jgi:hypothetical protein
MAAGGKGCSCSDPYDAISKAGKERIDKVNLLPFGLSDFFILFLFKLSKRLEGQPQVRSKILSRESFVLTFKRASPRVFLPFLTSNCPSKGKKEKTSILK